MSLRKSISTSPLSLWVTASGRAVMTAASMSSSSAPRELIRLKSTIGIVWGANGCAQAFLCVARRVGTEKQHGRPRWEKDSRRVNRRFQAAASTLHHRSVMNTFALQLRTDHPPGNANHELYRASGLSQGRRRLKRGETDRQTRMHEARQASRGCGWPVVFTALRSPEHT